MLLLLYMLSCTEQMVLVSISSSGYGRVTFYNSAESAIEVASGTKVTVIATPDENCEFKGWYVGNSDTPVSTEATYTFSANDDVALIAKFNEIKKIISVATSGNGSVAIKNKAGSSAEFVFGTTVSIVATPDEGYDFVGWFVNGSDTPVSTDATYTFTVSEDVSFIGKFVQAKKTVSVTTPGNGSVVIRNNGGETAELLAGSTVVVVATPNDKCEFLGWFKEDGKTLVSTDVTYIFTLSSDISLVAKFSECKKKLSVKTFDDGSVAIKDNDSKNAELLVGTNVTIIATPNDTYEFKGWFVDGSDTLISTEVTYTFVLNDDVSLVAKFEKAKRNVMVVTTSNGRATIRNTSSESADIAVGTIVAVSAIPTEDSEFLGWFVGNSDAPISTEEIYMFTLSEDIILIAKFSGSKRRVSVSTSGNGGVSIKDNAGSSLELVPGSNVTVVATPNENCNFEGWFVGNSTTPISTDAIYTFTLSEDVALVAKFVKTIKNVSVRATENGRVAIKDKNGSSTEILIGTDVTVIATPNEYCEFKGWFVGNSDTPISTDATYTFTVSGDVALVAKFAKPIINVSVITVGNGSVTIRNNGSESAELAAGTSVAVVATPMSGSDFVGWFVGNSETPVSTADIYMFTLTEDVILVAKFAEPSVDIDPVEIDLNPSGSIGGYDYVDLGLSVMWATYNVGASSLEEFGEYYAWGETTPYNNFTNINYFWSHYPCSPDRVIASIYDAATVNWGDQWRMPTYEEQQELSNGCKWIWVENLDNSNVSGYVGVSLKNNKCIFLPASGYKSHHDYEQPTETDAIYWSSTAVAEWGMLGFQAGTAANCIEFMPKRDNPVTWSIWAMGKGATVRAVVGAPNDYFPDPSDNVIDEAETSRQGFTVNGKIGGYTYVDMGLPSGTLWATYNVGAEMPTEYGDHFAWGETAPKSLYDKDTYAFFTGFSDGVMSMSQYSKYVWDKRCGKQDYKLILEDIDDAATVNWGSEWCMPTIEQYAELDRYCKVWRKDIVVNGKTIIGAIVESCINGNRMYIPYAGWEAGTMPNSYMHGWYWTSEVSEDANYRAKQMIVKDEEYILDTSQDSNREDGLSVRAVVKKNK